MNALFPCCSASYRMLPREGSRCCTVLEMTPSMLTLVACIVAVAAALILHKYWLCIPFGIGALASCHSIFIAYYASATRSIHESSNQLREQVETQEGQLAELEQVKTRLEQSVTTLEKDLNVQKKNNEDLSSRCEDLANRCEALREINEGYSKNLDTMCSSLETICTLKGDLEKQLENQGVVSESLQKSLVALSENAPQMVQLAQAIKELGLSQKIKELEEVYKRISESREELGRVEVTVEELKKTVQELGEMKRNLKEAQESYIKNVETALSELRREYTEELPEKVIAAIRDRMEKSLNSLKLNAQA